MRCNGDSMQIARSEDLAAYLVGVRVELEITLHIDAVRHFQIFKDMGGNVLQKCG